MTMELPSNQLARMLVYLWLGLAIVLPLALIVLLVVFVLYVCAFTPFAGRNRFPRYLEKSNPLKYNSSDRILNIQHVLSGDGQPTLSREFLSYEQIHALCRNANPPSDSTFRRTRAELQRLAEGSQVECSVNDRNLQNPFDRYHFVAIVE